MKRVGSCELGEARLPVQAVGVARGQHPTTKSLQVGMRGHAFHQPLAETLAACLLQHEHVAHPGERGAVGDDPRHANLSAVAAIDAEHDRALDGAPDDVHRHARRPVGLLAQELVNELEVEARRVSRDLEPIAALPLHDRRISGYEQQNRRNAGLTGRVYDFADSQAVGAERQQKEDRAVSQTMTSLANRVRWVDLATSDPAAAQKFYSDLFGWRMDVNDDPQYGGYAMAMVGEQGAAGIGGKQDPSQPTVWSLYIGTDDIDALAQKIKDNGGKVVAEPFDVGDQGKMAVFQDPSGGFISAWQGQQMNSFVYDVPNTFGWAELNARNVQDVVPFYEKVFGWSKRLSDMAPRSAALHRVPEGRREHPRRLGDERPDACRGAELLADLLQRRGRRCGGRQGQVTRRDRDGAGAGLPGRPVRDPDRPAGRLVRTASDAANEG